MQEAYDYYRVDVDLAIANQERDLAGRCPGVNVWERWRPIPALLPMTASGKRQRHLVRREWLRQTLRQL